MNPDSIFQLHALWHGSMSLAILFAYLYFRSFGLDNPYDLKFILLVSTKELASSVMNSSSSSTGLELAKNKKSVVGAENIDLV